MADETAARTDLADLARTRMDELQLSYRRASVLAVDPEDPESGSLWTRGTLENLANRRVIKAPGPAALRALAAALQLPLRIVQDAAAGQFMDIDTLWDEDEETRLMVRHYQSLTPEDREKLRAIAEAWGRPNQG
ncbi:XRE family transcriptional regulator [Streptomyces sp. NPDC058620]|uniref:XRE family transcriptional regulator n=1 Tax=Streptomyces sp. NPDC058620 TaxID=3346560 RepID=UPI003646B952